MSRSNLWRGLVITILSLPLSGCGLLEVSDPTAVDEADVANPAGAEMMRVKVIDMWTDLVTWTAHQAALLSDEYFTIPSEQSLQTGSIWGDHMISLRVELPELLNYATAPASRHDQLRINATHAIGWFGKYGAPRQQPHMGQMYAVRGYSILSMAENICAGFGLHVVVDHRPVYGPPLTTQEAFAQAVVDLDSALVLSADSARILNLARVLKARALTGMGDFAEAAVAAAEVPTDFVYDLVYGSGSGKRLNRMRLTHVSSSAVHYTTVADREGTNGLDFASAQDPRLKLVALGMAHDGVTTVYVPTKYWQVESTITIASGVEARLIEAEAALNSGSSAWLTILNELRADPAVRAAYGIGAGELGPLTDPGTLETRVDLLFRERAFWLFGTSHRLGDLRRLVQVYGRAQEDVFPVGAHPLSGTYETSTSLPFNPVNEHFAGTGVTGCVE